MLPKSIIYKHHIIIINKVVAPENNFCKTASGENLVGKWIVRKLQLEEIGPIEAAIT